MTTTAEAIDKILDAQRESSKPLAVILAGHNGSGKSTLWYMSLADSLQIPLINADRMMLSILPEAGDNSRLPDWASRLRDEDQHWMKVAQNGVNAFTAQAMNFSLPFAMETVFSYWQENSDGTIFSKIDLINDLQKNNYFVFLIFVGLSNATLSAARVSTRYEAGGHNVAYDKLTSRFPRTQRAISEASKVVDASLFVDNSLDFEESFSICRVEIGAEKIYDCRDVEEQLPPAAIREWLDIVKPI